MVERRRHLVPDENGDFRNSHPSRTFAREAEGRFSLAAYRRRNGADPFARSLHRGSEDQGSNGIDSTAMGVQARFGEGSVEDTRTWGNSTQQQLPTIALGHYIPVPTTQLIHVARRRPTSFNVLTVVTLGVDWTGEGSWNLVINYLIGVGQTSASFSKTVLIATPTNGLQIVYPDGPFPANAIQTNCVLSPLGSPDVTGTKTVLFTQLAAPVFE